MFSLRFPEKEVRAWASKYDYPSKDEPIQVIGAAAAARGHLTRDEFLKIALWKSHRPRKRCLRTSDDFVRDISHSALSSKNSRLKIEVLRLLDGVDWPSASVILHFCDKEHWPIIDFRTFWSLGKPNPAGKYSFELWEMYTEYTRALASRARVDMRTLDRALWAYSRQNQPSGA